MCLPSTALRLSRWREPTDLPDRTDQSADSRRRLQGSAGPSRSRRGNAADLVDSAGWIRRLTPAATNFSAACRRRLQGLGEPV